MTKYGSNFSATDTLKKANGTSHAAAVRAFANHFALATDGGTTETMVLAILPAGCVPLYTELFSDQNLSTINFTIGDGTTANKFGASTAGPNAAMKRIEVPVTLKLDPLTGQTTVLLTPSGAMPSTGNLRTVVYATQR